MYEMYNEPNALRSLLKIQLNRLLDNTERVLKIITDELGEIE